MSIKTLNNIHAKQFQHLQNSYIQQSQALFEKQANDRFHMVVSNELTLIHNTKRINILAKSTTDNNSGCKKRKANDSDGSKQGAQRKIDFDSCAEALYGCALPNPTSNNHFGMLKTEDLLALVFSNYVPVHNKRARIDQSDPIDDQTALV